MVGAGARGIPWCMEELGRVSLRRCRVSAWRAISDRWAWSGARPYVVACRVIDILLRYH